MDADDGQIVEHIKYGQQAIQDAVALLVERYGQSVYAHCFSWLRDASQAQIITEETFLKAPVALLEYKNGKLEVLLLKIATQLCATQRPLRWSTEWDIDEAGQEQTSKLSENDRVVLYLRRQNLKWREIASILGISEAAARQRGIRALNRLAEDAKSVRREIRGYK